MPPRATTLYYLLAVPLLLCIYWPPMIGIIGVLALVIIVVRTARANRRTAAARRAQLILDADDQHQAVLDGDPYGTHGRFTPAETR